MKRSLTAAGPTRCRRATPSAAVPQMSDVQEAVQQSIATPRYYAGLMHVVRSR